MDKLPQSVRNLFAVDEFCLASSLTCHRMWHIGLLFVALMFEIPWKQQGTYVYDRLVFC
jgi:hypothetical protein